MFDGEAHCPSCAMERHREDLKRDILADEIDSTDCENEIVCPWCGEIYEPEDDYELYQDGDYERECPYCEKRFKVNVSVCISYDTERVVRT